MKIVRTREEILAKKAAKRAAWLASPVALIEKPLKFIASRVNYFDKDKQLVISPIYTVAKARATRGDGVAVKQIAMAVNAKA